MKAVLNYLKSLDTELPIPVGKVLSTIPYKFRPGVGKIYSDQTKIIEDFKKASSKTKEEFVFQKFHKIFEHAYLNIPFCTDLYSSAGIQLGDIRSIEDIDHIPVISKKELMAVPLEERSYPVKNRLKVNTGGSSGTPFSFYMDPIRYGNEWAHIHEMWKKLGYTPSSLKLSFDGRSQVKDFIQYDFIRNSLKLDIYADQAKICQKLIKIAKQHKIEFLHGYPSAISEFTNYCNTHEPELLNILKSTLKGCFLSSEYPSPNYRDMIEKTFGIRTQSFYGHTETCIMAEEQEKFLYKVFQTYGYAESVTNEQGEHELIGTSYFNFASPLIRYNTQDLINPLKYDRKLLQTFKIKQGRSGDFILDKNGNKIAVTGLIFGRHHKIFDYCSHIQLNQTEKGMATILYVLKQDLKTVKNIETLFDKNNVDITFDFKKLNQPILTSSGKMKFLINEKNI